MSAPAHRRFSLARTQRLLRPGAFEAARRLGHRFVTKCFILNWLDASDQPASRLGVVTSRKVGSAVARSRARRLLREVYRRHQHALDHPMDVVLVARPSIARWRFQEVEREYLAVLGRNALLAKNP